MIREIVRVMFVALLGAGVPALSYSTARKPEILTAPRRALYFSAALSQWLLAVVGVAVVLAALPGFQVIGLRDVALATFLGWTLGLTLVASAALLLVIVLEGRGWWPPESELVYRLLPETRWERVWCVLVLAPTAGLSEEFLYRGCLLFQIAAWTHSIGWGAAASSVAFGLAHSYQGLNGMVRAGLLGVLLALPVVHLGSIYPSMAAHFLIDALALAWLGPRMLAPLRASDNGSGAP